MKNHFVISLLLLLALACNTEKKTAETGQAIATNTITTVEATTYTIDMAASSLAWTGSEGFAFNLDHAHNGTFNLTKGNLLVTDSTLTGSFEIDVNSLKVLDIKKEDRNKKLCTHLLGVDFFEAEKFPTASFEIVSVKALTPDSTQLTGNLTLKGVTKSVVFPVMLNQSDSTLNATARFYINRKDWGMHYRSEDSFGDEMIRPEVLIELNILARK
jgi:polyisoprenoid-binding protein YceI